MFTTRLISGIVLVILAIFFVGKGGALLFAVTALISLVGLFELYRVLGIEKRSVAAVGYLTAVCYYGILWFEGQKYLTLMIIASLMLLMALYVFTFPSFKTEEITGAFFGVCYVPVMLSFLYQTRSMHDGAYLVWLIFLSSWGCDTSAYCVGMLLGKHKLAPVLSPKKSIEGAVGLLMALILVIIWKRWQIPWLPAPLPALLRQLSHRSEIWQRLLLRETTILKIMAI